MSVLTEWFDEVYQTNPVDKQLPRDIAAITLREIMLDLVGVDREYGSNDSPDVIEQIKTEIRIKNEIRERIKNL